MKLLGVAAIALLTASAAIGANPHDPKKVILPAVQAKAKAINVRLSDLPAAAGWTAKPPAKDQGNPRCSYYDPDQSDLTENADANSPEFTLTSSSFVSSNTSIFKTAKQGRTAYARVVQPKLPQCLAEVFRKGSGQPKNVTIVSSAARKFPPLADRSNAYRIVADFKTGKTKVRIYLDVVVMNRGKVDAVVFFAGIGGAFKDSFEGSVTAKVAARTKNA